jgi:hypothetical protein
VVAAVRSVAELVALVVVDPQDFLKDRVFREADFLSSVEEFDWEPFREKAVLIRGCSSTVIPPWVYMYITGKLAGRARTVRYGNEHDNIVVYRKPA